jgi:hypothetical protein
MEIFINFFAARWESNSCYNPLIHFIFSSEGGEIASYAEVYVNYFFSNFCLRFSTVFRMFGLILSIDHRAPDPDIRQQPEQRTGRFHRKRIYLDDKNFKSAGSMSGAFFILIS